MMFRIHFRLPPPSCMGPTDDYRLKTAHARLYSYNVSIQIASRSLRDLHLKTFAEVTILVHE
jgi:hypothetical protein